MRLIAGLVGCSDCCYKQQGRNLQESLALGPVVWNLGHIALGER